MLFRSVEAMTLGDRVVVMKDGWIQQVGEPLELYGKPANKFVAGFIGSPAMNFAEATIQEEGGSVVAVNPAFRLAVPAARANELRAYKGQTLTLGVRPEDMRLEGDGKSVMEALVEVVEPLGSEILLDITVGTHPMVDRKSTRLNSSHIQKSRMPSSA